MIDILVPLLFGLSILLFLVALTQIWRTAIAAQRERFVSRQVDDLAGVFLFLSPRSVEALTLAGWVLGVLTGGLLLGVPGGLVAAAVLPFLPRYLLARLKERRRRQLDLQLMDALEQLATALAAGVSLPQAVESVARDTPAPLGQELGVIVREVHLGRSLEQAFLEAAERIGSDDLMLVATCVDIARTVGGNLAESLQSLAATARERRRVEGRIEALTSQGRLQGRVLSLLPALMALVLQAVQPSLFEPLYTPEGRFFGVLMVCGVVLLQLIGAVWLRKIVQIPV